MHKKASINWQIIFDELVKRRKANCDAIADMAVENFTEMRDKVGDPKFLLGKGVEKLLEKEFAGAYRSRYSLVTFSNYPYKLALEAGVVCEEILNELCSNIERPDQVDLVLAKKLIDAKLTPLLLQYGVSSEAVAAR
jgi:kynurenine 3-monooxygenase